MPYKRQRIKEGNASNMSEQDLSDSESLDNLIAICGGGERMEEEEDAIVGTRATPPYTSQQSNDSRAAEYHDESRMEEEESGSQPHAYSQGSDTGIGFRNKPAREKEILVSPLADASSVSEFYLHRTSHEKNLLVINPKLYDRWCCFSKHFQVITSQPQLSDEGVELAFVFPMVKSGLPNEAIWVIYFFSRILYLSNMKPFDGYCVPTETLKLQKPTARAKLMHILRVVESKGSVDDIEGDQDNGSDCEEDLLDLPKLIAKEDLNTEGEKKHIVPVLSIQVGITGTVCKLKNAQGQEKTQHDAYCVVSIRFLNNIQPLNYIVNYLLAPPGANSNQEIREEHAQMYSLLDEILLYQAAYVIGDTSGKLPHTYYSDPCGWYGCSTLCNPFLTPLKIAKLARRKYGTALFDLKIIGFYNIDWLRNPSRDPRLRAYMKYYNLYSQEIQKLYVEVQNAIDDYNTESKLKRRTKKNRNGAEVEQVEEDRVDPNDTDRTFTPIFGFPLEKDSFDADRFYFTKFIGSLNPIEMNFHTLRKFEKLTFAQFCSTFGTLQRAVMSALMDFMFFDYEFPEASKISDYALSDEESLKKCSLKDVEDAYWKGDNWWKQNTVLPGYLESNYANIVTMLKISLENGNTPHCVMQTFDKCEAYCFEYFMGIVSGGLMQSTRIEQLYNMIEDSVKAENNDNLKLNIHEEMLKYKATVLGNRSKNDVDPYVQSVELLYGTLISANQFWRLNQINIKNFLSIQLSMLQYVLPRDNSTVPAIGQGIVLAPACGTLSEMGPTKKLFPVIGCPNSAGKDFVVDKVVILFKDLATILNSEQFAIISNLSRSTAGSIEDYGCISVCDGKIVKYPERSIGAYHVDTELRGQDMDKILSYIITFLAPRGKSCQDKVSYTTIASENGVGCRKIVTRFPVMALILGLICTNPQSCLSSVPEQLETLLCVSYVTPPGSMSVPSEAQSSNFGDVSVNSAQVRSTNLEGDAERGVPLIMGLSHVYAYLCILLPLWAGAGPLTISPVVLATLDFLLFYINKHLQGIFTPVYGQRNFLRMREIYVARTCAFSCWILMLQSLCENKNRDEAVKQARRKFQFDALDITDIPSVCYELICRCIHWGPVILTDIFIKEVNMPIVPIDILVSLFRAENRPTSRDGELHTYYVKIQRWLFSCIDNDQFCPPSGNEETQTFCEYITSKGSQADGAVSGEKCVFSSDKAQNGWRVQVEPGKEKVLSVIELITENIVGEHKRALLEGCSFTEKCIPNILESMLKEFSIFIPKFLEIPQHNVERFFRFFDIWTRLPFVPYKTEKDASPPLAIKTARFRSSRESTSAGIGFNVAQLLILGSLSGEVCKESPHPNMVYALGRGIMKCIIQRLPGGAVPRKQVYIPSFNNIRNECIVVRQTEDTPEHFVRPRDTSLALSGKPSQLANVGKFAPEDVLHMPGLCSNAIYFNFSILRCPPSNYYNYHIREKRYYCAYNHVRNRLGLLFYNGREVVFWHYPNTYEMTSNTFNANDDGESESNEDSEVRDSRKSDSGDDDDSTRQPCSQREDTSQPMDQDGVQEAEEVNNEDDEEEEEGEVKTALDVKRWQYELCAKGFILLPMINRAGACVTVADELGERIGVLVPPPDRENADCNFHVKQKCYYVSASNASGRNHIRMSPFEVFDSLIPIGKMVFLKLESNIARQFMRRISLDMNDSDRSRFVIQMAMCSPNVFKPEVGMAYVSYVIHGDQFSEVICVNPSDLLVRPMGRTVIKYVFHRQEGQRA